MVKDKNTGIESPVVYKDVKSRIQKVLKTVSSKPTLSKNFLNSSGNSVSTTQLGHWLSTLTTKLNKKNSPRIKKMFESLIYKNNSVLKFIKNNGAHFAKIDALKNQNLQQVSEYSDMNSNDYQIAQLQLFAVTQSEKFYPQSIGVIANRENMIVFDSPFYTNEKLKTEYENQASTYLGILTGLVKNATPKYDNKLKRIQTLKEAQEKIVNDFNNLYLHQATLLKDGEVAVKNGMAVGWNDQIEEFIKIISPELQQAYSQNKVGDNKQFKSFQDLATNYFYSEALNRTYLGDIYAGNALLHTYSKKGAVESFIKRNSGFDSNGKKFEFDQPMILVVVDDMPSDSQAINGTYTTEVLRKQGGTMEGSEVGLSMKDQIYQVDPITSQQLFLKMASLNLDRTVNGHSLNSFSTKEANESGVSFNNLGNSIIAMEDYFIKKWDKEFGKGHGIKPYIKLMDKDVMKGTYSYDVVTIAQLNDATSSNNFEQIESKFSSVVIDNYRSAFNLDKPLKNLESQNITLSTQITLQQYNSLPEDGKRKMIDEFEIAAMDYLKRKMNNDNGDVVGEYEDSIVYENLIDLNYVISEMTKDLNDRDKTQTGKILEEIARYNNQNSNSQISSVDHPNLKLPYQQFVASRLTEKGIKLSMPGNFMHQLPSVDGSLNKLKHREVALPWAMFAPSYPEALKLLEMYKKNGQTLDVVAVRIPSSAEMTAFAGTVKYFLDTDRNVALLSDKFVELSDSDHDGDKAMVYREYIMDDGSINKLHTQSLLFRKLYDNLNTVEFVKMSNSETLSLAAIEKAVAKNSKLNKEYVARSINDITDVAMKLGLGRLATGRFSIASKFMSLLSQENEHLNEVLTYIGTNGNQYDLYNFTTKQVSDLARLLQAALDMANNPILAKTGFSLNTIDVGNVMMLLGVELTETINFLSSKDISKMSNDFDKSLSTFDSNEKTTFDKHIQDKYIKKNSKGLIDWELTKAQTNKDVLSFLKFKIIADGISKMIPYVQLDKNLPNTEILVNKLIEDIDSTDESLLPFTIDNLKKRPLNVHRKKVLDLEKKVLDSTSLKAVPRLEGVIENMAKSMVSPNLFKKEIDNQLMHYFSQFQLSTKRDNPSEFVYGFPETVQNIVKSLKDGAVNIEAGFVTKDIYEATQAAINEEGANQIYEEKLKEWSIEIEKSRKEGNNIEDSLARYQKEVDEVNKNKMFKDNIFLNSIEFNEKENKTVMSLSKDQQATKGMRDKIEKAFNDIQNKNPQLAKDFIDYQLYRHGVNDKIGSFIGALPVNIHSKMLAKSTRFRKDFLGKESVTNELNEIKLNTIAQNKDIIKQPKESEIKKEFEDYLELKVNRSKFIVYNENIYERLNNQEGKTTDIIYKKPKGLGDFKMDDNFVSYIIDKALDKKSSLKEAEEFKKKCITRIKK